MKAIIADTSCLIIYEKINQFGILEKTFEEILITKEVAEEFGYDLPDWIKIAEISDKEKYLRLTEHLGRGEASSITLALEMKECLLIMDEKKGRRIAEELKVDIIGSLGVLVKAKERGAIDSVSAILKLIDQTNFRISKSVKAEILKQSGETDQ
jgi:predicted nucleic acid-binding protein